MNFEYVTLEMLGHGGDQDDIPLTEEVKAEIVKLGWLVTDPSRGDKATITIKIHVEAKDSDSVLLSYDTSTKEPSRHHKALSAIVTEEGVMAYQQKQESLPHTGRSEAVVPITKTNREGGS
jgi:hypothetical protein